MKKLLIAASAVALTSVPAQAQLLGSGSLTGGLTSGLDLNTTISRTTETVRSTTRGAVNGSASTDGSQSVDRKSGKVEARRSADLTAGADVVQLANTPIAPVAASSSASGQASGNGEAQAQLIGTDAVRQVAGSAVGQTRDVAGLARGLAAPAVEQARAGASSLPGQLSGIAGSGSAAGSASGEGSASLGAMPLAVAGSAASAANGAATIIPGMPVVSPEGVPVGKVRQIVADSRGQVQQVLVSSGDAKTLIPAGSLTASGGALIAASSATQAATNSSEDEGA